MSKSVGFKWSWPGLKKRVPSSIDAKRRLVDWDHESLSVRRQCELLGLARSSLYLEPIGESAENLKLMRMMDEQYLKTPFFGSRRMLLWLKDQGHSVNRKRVRRLMKLLGIEALYPKPKTTRRDHEHRVYPYLLRGLRVDRPNQVWASDITYIPMETGFLYLVAVLDWYSRYVVSWRLSNTLEDTFCREALEEALLWGTPEIFNTDQGSQFTARAFTGRLEQAGIQVSMDGKGRALDNVFVERLWWSVKYEEVYLKSYESVSEVEQGLSRYFEFYTRERRHSALENRTPAEVYFGQTS
jgi:putative transposase